MATTTRATVTNKPSLKSQGAGYSTTNRQGTTTYYKKASDASGYSDTANGKNVATSAGKPMSQVDATGKVITPTSLAPTTAIVVPPKPIANDVGGLMAGNNSALASSSGGLYTHDTNTGQLVVPPAQDVLTAKQPTALENLFKQYTDANNSAFADMGNSTDRLAKLERDNQLKQKQQAVNDYTAQLNGITAKAQAESLGLEGQGRGITESIIGGQQAQINREAAIQALPIQAQLAAAQGNLEMAQSHIDKMFQIQSQDAQAQYQYKTNLYKSVYDFANAQEQRKLDALQKADDRAYDMQKTNLSLKNDWAKTAVEYGQSSLAGRIMALDPKSATFTTDLAVLQGKVSKPVVAKTPDAPTIQKINGMDMQWDAKTGTWINPNTGATAPANVQNLATTKSNIDTINSVLTNPALKSSVGTSFLSRTSSTLLGKIGQAASIVGLPAQIRGGYDTLTGNKQNFIAGVSQLQEQLTLDNLVNAKANGATFGALSEAELKLLQKSASKLNTWSVKNGSGDVTGYNTDEKTFKNELDKIGAFAKLDYVLKGGAPEDVNIFTTPDGKYNTTDSFGNIIQLN